MTIKQNQELSDVCTYLKNVVIKHTPDDFIINEQFRFGLSDAEILAGINAFRTFLYQLYDKIAAEDSKIGIDEFAAVLYFIGIQGELESQKKRELSVRGSDLLIKTKKNSVPHQTMKKMSAKRVTEIFMFLSGLDFSFADIDYTKPIKLSETGVFCLSSEKDSDVIVGLKLLAKAQEHLDGDRDRLQNGFMRCDFQSLASEVPILPDMKMVNYADTQPPDVKDWLLDLDKLLTDNGCRINAEIMDYARMEYWKGKQLMCTVHLGITECKIAPSTKKIKTLDDIASVLPDAFVAALKEDGCECGRGCKKGPFRILHNGEEYLSCINPPHKPAGFLVPLHNEDSRKIIRRWIEEELSS